MYPVQPVYLRSTVVRYSEYLLLADDYLPIAALPCLQPNLLDRCWNTLQIIHGPLYHEIWFISCHINTRHKARVSRTCFWPIIHLVL